ncbi:MAG: zinc ABC transporter substrate-binding protein [Brevinematales bacterium]
MKKYLFFLFFLTTFVFAEKPIVLVSILPQQEFVEKIAKDKVIVKAIVEKGASPHNYEPTPKQLLYISKARIWLAIGIDFEKALISKVKSLYPNVRIVEITNGVKYRTLEEHHHEDEKEEHSTLDPHIWLGYEQVKTILSNTLINLKQISPENEEFFEKNYKEYLNEIDITFKEMKQKMKPLEGKTIFVYHPAFGYFFDNFGITQRAFEVRGKEPTQKEILSLIKEAKKENAKVIFVQKQFSKNAAKIIAKEIGGKVIEIDPLEKKWLENIKYMGNIIIEANK